MSNAYAKLISLLPTRPLMVGTVQSIADGVATITLYDGSNTQARGSATVGTKVWFKDGMIEGQAPDLTELTADV